MSTLKALSLGEHKSGDNLSQPFRTQGKPASRLSAMKWERWFLVRRGNLGSYHTDTVANIEHLLSSVFDLDKYKANLVFSSWLIVDKRGQLGASTCHGASPAFNAVATQSQTIVHVQRDRTVL